MKYGLIGRKLGHSFSKAFFTDKFRKEGIDAVYENYELQSIDEFPELLKANKDIVGLNVTIPYKTLVIPFLDELSDEARDIGAVNVVKRSRASHDTVLRTYDTALPTIRFATKRVFADSDTTKNDGEKELLIGFNTDCIGFTQSLLPFINLSGSSTSSLKALVLGTGGVSKAVQYSLKKLGIEFLLVSRNAERGITYKDIDEEVMREHHLIVNCTPLGMAPSTDTFPEIPYNLLTREHMLFDCVYGDNPTMFLQLGRRYGARIKDGTEMLRLQALAAWNIWND